MFLLVGSGLRLGRRFSILRGMATRIAPQIRDKVELSDAEDNLCNLLDEFTRHLKLQDGIVTVCRINGGWVRDKLLNYECNDVDVCLEDMMGVPFAERFVAFLSERKHVSVHKVTKIESNPDQSKHLETARTTLFGIDLDFVNLRSEEYSEHSRIPTEVKFGTPLQDALRRDITINSLFYNIHTRAVEDFTEKGLDDLRNGIIRTPLPPLQTFRDDPLRVIRCVRFASRFGFAMTPELQDAARDQGIQETLSSKISRERIGEELDKMMRAVEPLHAVQIIHDLSLYHTIFHVPTAIIDSASASVTSPELSLTACTILHDLLSSSTTGSRSFTSRPHPTLVARALNDRGTRARLFLGASLYSFAGITYRDHKEKVHSLVEAVIREGLKLGNKNYYLDSIPALFDAAALFKGLSLEDARFTTPSERVAIGLLLRHGKVHKPTSGSHWSSSLFFSLVCELVPLAGEEADECIRRYNAFTSRIEELGLDAMVDAKPLLNGNEVISVFGGKPGPWTAVALAKVMEWQLENLKSDKGACTAWLEEEQRSGRINIEDLVKSTCGTKRIHADSKEGLKRAKRTSQ